MSPTASRGNIASEELAQVPDKPGVYIFRDKSEKALYVGKAKNLRNRIRSYFLKSQALDARKTAMVKSIADFEYTVTSNELEAFVLESNLIKQYRPRYNVLLRDDKNYPYLKLTINEAWPRLEVARKIQKDGARYYGPYVPSGPMWTILSFIRNTFHIRTCRHSLEKTTRPCIQYQIKRCIGPCTGLVDHDAYMKTIGEIRLLLEGRNSALRAALEKQMKRRAEDQEYEEAAIIRDRIEAIQKISESQKIIAPQLGDADVFGFYRSGDRSAFKVLFIRNGMMTGSRHFHLYSLPEETDAGLLRQVIGQLYGKGILPPAALFCPKMPEDAHVLVSWLSQRRGSPVRCVVPKRGVRRQLMDMAAENARILFEREPATGPGTVLSDVARLLHLRKIPSDIGAFDISNIAGKEPVGAFVWWEQGGFRKNKYRHIRMDAVPGPDDYSMMKEMIRRTVASTEGGLPDLLIIDGGRAHLEAALEVLGEFPGNAGDVIGLAKDPDRAVLAAGSAEIPLDDGSQAALLLRRLRDEAHRFAITYHKKLRSRAAFSSPLEQIPGIGRKRRFALLKHFDSIEALRNASVDEIAALRGFNRKLAETIHITLAQMKKG